VLGDLPLLGPLFRRRTEVDTPRYLLIFVTASIVKDTGEFLVYDDVPSNNASPPPANSPAPLPQPAAAQSAAPATNSVAAPK
jgi:type II secretory pathway component GspD/PulD (secretin)